MGRPSAPPEPAEAERRADPAGGAERAPGPARRLAIVVGVVLAGLALALLPGWGPQPADPLDRALSGAVAPDGRRPTTETVQELAAELAARDDDQPIDPDRVAAVVTSPGPYTVLGQLQIPVIGVDVEIGNGVDPDTLALGPGHWTGTPLPGELGNAVLSGHRTTHTAPFRELDELTEGNEITVTTAAGTSTTYTVSEVLVVPVADYTGEVLAQPADGAARELTLFACHPEGSLTHRIVVHALALPA